MAHSHVARLRARDDIDPRSSVRWSRLGPGLVALAATVWFTVSAGVPLGSVALYLLAFVWSVMVPGVLVHRALCGRPASVVSDLALGGATGLVLQLIAWVAFTGAHVAGWLVLWPLAVVIPFAVAPRLRRHWGFTPYRRTVNPAAAWLTLVAYLLPVFALAVGLFSTTNLPPASNIWYPDDLWHLALSAELMRSVPPDIPQLAGNPFFYHWFSNAHIAAMTWTTGLDLPVVFLRLWMAPVIALAVGVVFAVTEQLARRTWPGAVAALLLGSQAALFPTWLTLPGFAAFGLHSPSQVFSIPIIGLALHSLVHVLRDRRVAPGRWVLLFLSLAGASGAKSSVVPVLVCGVGLALLVALVGRRALVPRLLAVLGLSLVLVVLTAMLTGGSSAGVIVQLFSTVRASQPWVILTGTSSPFSKASVLPGLAAQGAPKLLALVLATWALGYAWAVPGLKALKARDLSGWLLLGVGLGGFAAMMLLSQDGLSQVYFMSGAVVALYPLAGWGLALAWDSAASSAGRGAALRWSLVGAGTAPALLLVWRTLSGPTPTAAGLNGSLLRGLVVPTLVTCVLLAALVVGRRSGGGPSGSLAFLAVSWLAVTAALVPRSVPGAGGPLPAGTETIFVVAGLVLAVAALGSLLWVPRRGRASRRTATVAANVVLGLAVVALVVQVAGLFRTATEAEPRKSVLRVSVAEASAAQWLEANSDPDDVVATNVHCRAGKTVAHCDSRAFWVSALTQRRSLVESWAYTASAHERHGVGGRPYSQQPFENPQLLALNEGAFRAPTTESLAALKGKGVRWLLADTKAGTVSPRLSEQADLVHESGTVKIFRLR
ncbi:hypothetical protein [Terrabacter sp. 2RAF25]|uniref:hypothetical protein n=1 Tax=Terrabacter sp. 2RAF25 TaxID=3232998 RepID=UPI003F9D356B